MGFLIWHKLWRWRFFRHCLSCYLKGDNCVSVNVTVTWWLHPLCMFWLCYSVPINPTWILLNPPPDQFDKVWLCMSVERLIVCPLTTQPGTYTKQSTRHCLGEVFQTLHAYNLAFGKPIHTRFDDLNLILKSQVCEKPKLQILCFRFLSL